MYKERSDEEIIEGYRKFLEKFEGELKGRKGCCSSGNMDLYEEFEFGIKEMGSGTDDSRKIMEAIRDYAKELDCDILDYLDDPQKYDPEYFA